MGERRGRRVSPEGDGYLPVMEFLQECASLTGWQEVEVRSSNGMDVYVVTLPPWDRSEEEAVCECPSYEFRSRCRHQREAMSLACMWTELDSIPQTLDQRGKMICPECGGKTQLVVIGDR